MINYFGGYATDDAVNYPKGNGNILSFYGYSNYNKGWSFLILFGYIIFNISVARLFMTIGKNLIILYYILHYLFFRKEKNYKS